MKMTLEEQLKKFGKRLAKLEKSATYQIRSLDEIIDLAKRKKSVFIKRKGVIPAAFVQNFIASYLHFLLKHEEIFAYEPKQKQ